MGIIMVSLSKVAEIGMHFLVSAPYAELGTKIRTTITSNNNICNLYFFIIQSFYINTYKDSHYYDNYCTLPSSSSKVEPSGLVNPFLIYTPFCAFKVTVFPEPTVTLPKGFLLVDVMNDVSPFNDWKEKSVLLNANEYSRVRWAFAPNGIAVHRHRSHNEMLSFLIFDSFNKTGAKVSDFCRKTLTKFRVFFCDCL